MQKFYTTQAETLKQALAHLERAKLSLRQAEATETHAPDNQVEQYTFLCDEASKLIEKVAMLLEPVEIMASMEE